MCLQDVKAGEIQSAEHLVSALSCASIREIILGAKTLTVVTPAPQDPESTFAVLEASTTGATVHKGAVLLRHYTVLLLTGTGVHFHGTSFTGTIPGASLATCVDCLDGLSLSFLCSVAGSLPRTWPCCFTSVRCSVLLHASHWRCLITNAFSDVEACSIESISFTPSAWLPLPLGAPVLAVMSWH